MRQWGECFLTLFRRGRFVSAAVIKVIPAKKHPHNKKGRVLQIF